MSGAKKNNHNENNRGRHDDIGCVGTPATVSSFVTIESGRNVSNVHVDEARKSDENMMNSAQNCTHEANNVRVQDSGRSRMRTRRTSEI